MQIALDHASDANIIRIALLEFSHNHEDTLGKHALEILEQIKLQQHLNEQECKT